MKKDPVICTSIAVFVFFLCVSFLAPITGDDWGNYVAGKDGLQASWDSAINMYKVWEGRFASRFVMNLLTPNKIIWNILNACIMSGIFYLCIKLINPKRKLFTSLILFAGILLVENTMFMQCYIWIAGNVTYTFPLFLALINLIFLRNLFEREDDKTPLYIVAAMAVLNFITPMFVEHIAVFLIATNLIGLILCYVKCKKINKVILLNAVISILAFLPMYFSPGNVVRKLEEGMENRSAIIIILRNIPDFIEWTIARNSFLLILVVVVMIYLILTKIKKRNLKVILVIYVLIIPIINIVLNIANLTSLRGLDIIQNLDNIFVRSAHVATILYWTMFVSLFVYLISISIKEEKRRTIYLMLGLSIIPNLVMLASPIWGGRTAMITVYLLYITILMIIEDIDIKGAIINKANRMVLIVLSGSVLLFLYLYSTVFFTNIEREKTVKEGIAAGKETIYIESFPEHLVHTPIPTTEYHVRTFKACYGIKEETRIERKTPALKD